MTGIRIEPDSTLAHRLSTISSRDPKQIRCEVLEALIGVVPAELAVFYNPIQGPEGTYYVTGVHFAGSDDELTRWFRQFIDGELPETPWLPPEIDRRIINRFIRVRAFYDDETILSYGVMKDIMLPVEVPDNLRAVLYDGNRMMGWLGLMRRGLLERFTRAEEEILNEVISQIRSALAAAEALESDLLGEGICAVLMPSGVIEHASAAFQAWYNGEQRDGLKQLIATADRRKKMPAKMVFQGHLLRLVRLDGIGGVRYMVTAEQSELLRITPAMMLTKRQREIVDYVVAGATSREIAEALQISYYTVRTHMKNIYRRLDVASKVDLIDIWGEG